MSWIKVVIIFCLMPLLHGHKVCTQKIRWKELFHELNSLNSNISPECGHDFDKTVLCNPQEMLNQIEHNAMAFMDIMKMAESVYKKIKNSQKVIEMVKHTSYILTPCVHPPHGAISEPVTACFAKLEAFLMNKKFRSNCAGEIANITVREILQRLQKQTERRRRR
ncbi:uncharacterized protein ifnu [Alosa pseudoharengus]|uniref:uncharacterized protein ifnu n=1 Tax=Alosa pseudoharengus TaxID=34774 RepID=UPI003F8C7BA4